MTAKLIKVTMVNDDPLHFAHEQFVSVRSLSASERRDLASFAKTTSLQRRRSATLSPSGTVVGSMSKVDDQSTTP